MAINLKGRSLLTLKDFSKEEILYLLELAAELKEKKKKGLYDEKMKHKNIALIFEKASTRTRCAFAVACADEGANSDFLSKNDIQLGGKESVEDTARVLGRMYDGIEFRGFEQTVVEELAEKSGVPVWNGLTDLYHPTQVLADFLTIKENFGKLEGINFTYVGDGRNNIANSLLIGASKVGMNFTLTSPKSLKPTEELIKECLELAKVSGSKITFTESPAEGVKNADVVYTDVWVSMGEEAKSKERLELLKPYQVNTELMSKTGNAKTIFMHDLPAVKENEVTAEVFESKVSVVFDQAENRMHTIKAVMVATIC